MNTDARRTPSYGQQRLWVTEKLHPGLPAYTITHDFRLRGPLDVAALGLAFRHVVGRHEVLRSRFGEEQGTPHVLVGAEDSFRLEFEDLSHHPDPLRAAGERAGAEAARVFDLSQGPLFRAGLARLGTDDHILLLTAHHSVFDAWSLDVLARDLSAAYRALADGRRPELPELRLSYAEFAAEQRDRLSGEIRAEYVDFWRGHLGTEPQPPEPAGDRQRPQVPSHRGDVVEFTLDEELTTEVGALARRHHATPFMVLLAAYQAVLSRWAGTRQVIVGCPSAGRTEPELEDLVGYFVNVLPLRADLTGSPTFSELIAQVRTALLEAFSWQELPFEQLVEELGLPGRLDGGSLIQNTFQLLHTDPDGQGGPFSLPGIEATPFADATKATRFDIEMHLLDRGQAGLTGYLVYATDLFDAATMDRFVRHYRAFLAAVCADPDAQVHDIRMLGADEERLLAGINATDRQLPPVQDVLERFEEVVRRNPEATAVVSGPDRLTYAVLDARAQCLAAELRRQGLGTERVAGVLLPRGVDLVVSWLAVLRSGAACLPLDPRLPRERMAFMLRDSGARLILTDAGSAGSVPGGVPTLLVAEHQRGKPSAPRPAAGSPPGALMHLIYTSGSTGRPKGVAIERRSFANLLDWHLRETGLGPGDITTQVANVSFDAAGWEIWSALLAGATVHFPPDDTVPSAERLIEYFRETGTTVAFATTAMAEELVSHPLRELTGLRTVLTGGDLFRPQPSHAPGVPVLNVYGPTETTVLATASRLELPQRDTGIGRPIDNVRVYVLDDRLRPVGVGLPGEICIAGAGLARGYVGAPAMTAERFLPDPFAPAPGGRLYRTGDLGRWTSRGTLEFLGRADRQVKIRGYRVETGEVEIALRALPEIRDAAVGTARISGVPRLIAWYVPEDGQDPARGELRTRLSGTLPEYMLPDVFVPLPGMPITTSGKIDRKSLPVPDGTGAEYVAPRDECEAALAQLWADVLGLPRVGVEDDFFEIGGHSLIATRITSRITDLFGVDVSLRALFERRTVAALARLVEEQVAAEVAELSEEELLAELRTSEERQ
ncbi:amino acid adenylation domain-containing protein [Streptomyces sp. NPDC052396]|uniref:amino acid adenylation domain-containing protein n=1 Tax=Streptomyces sp. NPDC052396 TaxID=3365689 RepID=UPI0037D8D347